MRTKKEIMDDNNCINNFSYDPNNNNQLIEQIKANCKLFIEILTDIRDNLSDINDKTY